MAITKPFTFRAGEKARANEVNQDFDVLYAEVNRIGSEIIGIKTENHTLRRSWRNRQKYDGD